MNTISQVKQFSKFIYLKKKSEAQDVRQDALTGC